MKTMDLFWMRQHTWAVIFTGEAPYASVAAGKFVPDVIHAAMCACGKSVAECGSECVVEVTEAMKDSEHWRFAEHGKPFSFAWEFEISQLSIARISSLQLHDGVRRLL